MSCRIRGLRAPWNNSMNRKIGLGGTRSWLFGLVRGRYYSLRIWRFAAGIRMDCTPGLPDAYGRVFFNNPTSLGLRVGAVVFSWRKV